MKKKVLIVFPDEWIAYAPTVLNFIECFKETGFEVTALAVDNGSYEAKIDHENVEYIKIHPLISRVLMNMRLYKTLKIILLWGRLLRIKGRNHQFDVVLAVDYVGFIPARTLFSNIILLSLEATKNVFYHVVRFMKVDCLIIQTKERKEHLFGSSLVNVYYIQNSPRIPQGLTKERKNNKRLIFLGNIIAEHGVEECIDSLALLDNYVLFLKGAVTKDYLEHLSDKYKGLIAGKRLNFDFEYVEQDEILSYLSNFDIGFCLYNMKIIGEKDFNYISIPSGKLFNYYAVGLPVIGLDIQGLRSVHHYRAGVLVSQLDPYNIVTAIQEIEKDYQEYSRNSYKASRDFDFNKSFGAFIKDYLGEVKNMSLESMEK